MNDLVWEYENTSILDGLKSVLDKKESCQVWQTIDGQRALYNCVIDVIDEEDIKSRSISLSGLAGERELSFSTGHDIYCRFSGRGILFKTQIISTSNESVVVSFPKEVMLEESRGRARNTFGLYSSFLCDISFSENSLMNNGYKIFDISLGGICLLVGDTEKKYFEEARDLYMTSIQGIQLSSKTNCRICHIGKVEAGKKSEKHKVGIEFEPKLDEEDYLKVIESVI